MPRDDNNGNDGNDGNGGNGGNDNSDANDDKDKYNADNYSTEELLQLLNLPSNVDEVTANDVMLVTSSKITMYKTKAVSNQLVSPKNATAYLRLSLFFKEIQVKLLAAVNQSRLMNTDADKAAAVARDVASGAGWDAAVAQANAAASASIRARAREEAAAAAAAVARGTGSSAEPDVLAVQRQQEEQDRPHHSRSSETMTDDTMQMRWMRNQYLPQTDGAEYTDRSNQFELSRDRNEHYIMMQRRLGVPSAYNVSIAQGTMNPTLRNTYRRTVIINSKRRAVIFPHSSDPLAPSSSTNFNVQLSEELKNVVSLHMMSITVPYAWYAVDAATGTNCFHVTLIADAQNQTTETITVPTGNYTPSELVAAIQAQIIAYTNNADLKDYIRVSYSPANGLCTFHNISGTTSAISPLTIKLTFFDPARKLDCAAGGGCKQTNKINNSLGWILGFRSNDVHTTVLYNSFALDGMVYTAAAGGSLTGEAVVDTYGPKYFMIVLDDYKNNRINCGVVSVTTTETRLDTPYYYDGDIPCERIPDPFGGPTDRITVNYPSNPRTLTEVQLYTVNEIRRNRELTTVDRVAEPTASNVFAITHVNKIGLAMGTPLTDSSPAIAAHKREYFGPVTLQRFKVTLVDDNGFAVNLNGNDWSFTFSAESLYEY